MRDPLLPFCAAVCAGVFLRHCIVQVPAHFGAFVGIAVACAVLGAWLLKTHWRLGLGLTAALLSGVLAEDTRALPETPVLDADSQESLTFEGCVVEPTVFSHDREQFTLEIAPGARARVSLQLNEGESPPRLVYGQRVSVEGRARPPRNFGNPGAFDYVRYMARQGIYWDVGTHLASLQPLKGSCGSAFWKVVYDLRQTGLERIDALYSGDEYADGMMRAILLGDSARLEKLWTEDFRNTGTFHALVISGLHVSVLAGVLFMLLRLMGISEITALVLTALAAWLYALVSGYSAPAVRAAGGFTLYLVARFLFRRTRVLNLLSAVAIGYVLFDPEQMFEASFQLSFFSVAVIGAIAAPILERWIQPRARALQHLADEGRDDPMALGATSFRLECRLAAETAALCLGISERFALHFLERAMRFVFWAMELTVISGLIQVGLALPMLYYFHRLSITGLTANLFVVPAMSMLVPLGFAALFTGWHWLAQVALFPLTVSRAVVDWHMHLEPQTRVPDPPLWTALLFCGLLLWWGFELRRSGRWWQPGVLAVAWLGALLYFPFGPLVEHGKLEMTAIDVGQGDSLLVSLPQGGLMLVDGGGIPVFGKAHKSKMDVGEDVVSPYLWSRRIRHLNVVVCTHSHEDHMGGLLAVMRNFHPDVLWTGAHSESREWKILQAEAERDHVPVRELRGGEDFTLGGVEFTTLSPPPDYEPPRDAKNNDSLVMRLTYGARSFLLTGDMEKQMEARLVEDNALKPVDVLKVGHHGSKTSSTEAFLDLIQPQYAVISLGFENSYHFPAPVVIERLEQRHAQVFRTDQAGLVSFTTDGKSLDVRPYRVTAQAVLGRR